MRWVDLTFPKYFLLSVFLRGECAFKLNLAICKSLFIRREVLG